MQNFKKKICLIVDSLSSGGAERSAALLSLELDKLDYEVSVICLRNEITYSFKGELYNLGLNDSNIKLVKQASKFLKFKKAYTDVNADFYIDFRMRNRFLFEYLLHTFVFDISKIIFTIHSFEVFYHIPKNKWFYNQYRKAHAIVGVSNTIIKQMQKLFPFNNLNYISNFYQKDTPNIYDSPLEITTPFILAVGRLNNVIKQFDQLIDAYLQTNFFKAQIPLYIIGEGKDRGALEKQINEKDIVGYVHLLGFKSNVKQYMKLAKIVVMSSSVEGFPMVLLEALNYGTPVVSFDCPSGPSELIIDGENGLLVENQNFEALITAMDKMHTDQVFYKHCKSKTQSTIQAFSKETVMAEWIKLFTD
ncbi:glycosyltransferase [Flavobacteriaceae bacterium]|nr:glycosyltransferase [Flavobacteriaceae bacterium]